MASRETIASRCISVEKVPTDLRKELLYKIAERLHLADREISVEEVPGFHVERGWSRFVFLLDNKQSKCSHIFNILEFIWF